MQRDVETRGVGASLTNATNGALAAFMFGQKRCSTTIATNKSVFFSFSDMSRAKSAF
jgi:hypothetical protein